MLTLLHASDSSRLPVAAPTGLCRSAPGQRLNDDSLQHCDACRLPGLWVGKRAYATAQALRHTQPPIPHPAGRSPTWTTSTAASSAGAARGIFGASVSGERHLFVGARATALLVECAAASHDILTHLHQPTLPCLTTLTLTHCDTLLFNTHMTSSGHEAPPMLAINPTNTTHNDLRRGSNRYGDPTYTRTLYTTISMLCMCLLSAMAGAHQHIPFSF
jgi:hypothetical protein